MVVPSTRERKISSGKLEVLVGEVKISAGEVQVFS